MNNKVDGANIFGSNKDHSQVQRSKGNIPWNLSWAVVIFVSIISIIYLGSPYNNILLDIEVLLIFGSLAFLGISLLARHSLFGLHPKYSLIILWVWVFICTELYKFTSIINTMLSNTGWIDLSLGTALVVGIIGAITFSFRKRR